MRKVVNSNAPKLFALAFALLALVSCRYEPIPEPSAPAGSLFDLRGEVFDQNGSPLANALVYAADRNTHTDSLGRFEFSDIRLCNGSTSIRVKANGYEDAFEEFVIHAGQMAMFSVKMNAELTPEASSSIMCVGCGYTFESADSTANESGISIHNGGKTINRPNK